MCAKMSLEKRPRGRPPKTRERMRRDHERDQLANLGVWLMVESKRKGFSRLSAKRACELITKEIEVRRASAPKNAQELLDGHHKYLLNADTLRRRYNSAEALRKRDRSVAAYLARELERLGPWATTIVRQPAKDS